MFDGLLSIELTTGPFPITLDVLGIATLLALFLIGRTRRWVTIKVIAAIAGLSLGFVLAWLLGDVLDVFDVSLSFAIRAWFSAATGAIGVAIATVVVARRWRIVVPVVGILLFAVIGAVGINADVGQFPDLRSALGIQGYSTKALPAPVEQSTQTDAQTLAAWTPPSDLPQLGRLNTVTIPGTVSGFRARPALVYLPPAAIVAHPPRLPLLVMMGGQPGSPSTMISAGQLEKLMDAYAKAHRGLAPIVVIPDQLGAPELNPMCVDSALGNSATYLTADVPNWIRTHLNVFSDRHEWAIGGFSQGGTCSIQIGAEFPQLFGSIFDISGELKPRHGSPSETIRLGFAGSAQAYAKAAPANILSTHAPYADSFAIFAVGANDVRYRPNAETLLADARSAGMTVRLIVSPATSHDWHTVRYAIANALPVLGTRWGIDD